MAVRRKPPLDWNDVRDKQAKEVIGSFAFDGTHLIARDVFGVEAKVRTAQVLATEVFARLMIEMLIEKRSRAVAVFQSEQGGNRASVRLLTLGEQGET